jgi:hypothetical protein
VINAFPPDRSDQPFGNAIVKGSQLHSYRLIGRKPPGYACLSSALRARVSGS